MADEEQLISSTTPLFPEGHHYQADPDPEPDLEPKQNLFSADDIVDLVGGAQDALERHIAEDSVLQEFSLTSTEPEVREPEPEPAPEPVVERAVPDSSFSFVPEKPEVLAPKAEPESTRILPEPQAEPDPESDALLAAVARKASPAPAEASDQPTVTQEPAAPASCEYLTGRSRHGAPRLVTTKESAEGPLPVCYRPSSYAICGFISVYGCSGSFRNTLIRTDTHTPQTSPEDPVCNGVRLGLCLFEGFVWWCWCSGGVEVVVRWR
uniref:Uncharacterized protein n=1 Tax=Nothobranchius furzeri TaxID=105023 RepID=A0A8C6M9Z2_NOTFU